MSGSRVRTVLNWLLLGVNSLLLIFLASRWQLPSPTTTVHARKSAVTLGMDVYVAKDPFVLAVDKDFSHNRSFVLLVDEQVLSIRLDDTAGLENAEVDRHLCVNVGSEFSIACDYSSMKKQPWASIKKITLMKQHEGKDVGLMDLNADGFYDLRMRHKAQQSFPTQIWYQDGWRDVLADDASHKGGLYKKRLQDVGEVVFDLKTGHWLSSTGVPKRTPTKSP